MRVWSVLIGGVAFLSLTAHRASCQIPCRDGASPQIRKEWVLGQRTWQDLEQRDGRISDPANIGYLRRIEEIERGAIGAQTLEVRLTRSSDHYAALFPNGVLYISSGLLERIENEAELVGLLAHELAHVQAGHVAVPKDQGIAIFRDVCVLASRLTSPGTEDVREWELQATTAAIGYLKAVGYDPAGVLDLFSKLAYEHPAWANAIVPKDLLELRVRTEAGDVPPGGYRIESSECAQHHAMLEMALGHDASNSSCLLSRPFLSRRR